MVFACIGLASRRQIAEGAHALYEKYGVAAAGHIIDTLFPALSGGGAPENAWVENDSFGARMIRAAKRLTASARPPLFSYLEQMEGEPWEAEDPAYERFLAEKWENDKNKTESEGDKIEDSGQNSDNNMTTVSFTAETIAKKPSGQTIIKEKLADYDYLMGKFYSVHPTAAAGRDMMNAEEFLSMDLSLKKDTDTPQILIYHTHSQETFADYPENPEATIVGVGAYLTELLRKKGYNVIHDTSVYDFKDGSLDRSQAYTYALNGISGILQEYPSIEVVLDVHRDGVNENVRLVQEIDGKPTAQIMFFNGTSQTPDGPIEYLPNPNRSANLAFSFQMQLAAADRYPGFTRKIYLKGLRYNQHVRARSALIEAGAQTNTYEEVKNAMEPLSEILDEVLGGGKQGDG